MSDKPLVFISHITEEKALAAIFQEEIDRAFLGIASSFVSSDEGNSIPGGARWMDRITDGLENAKVMFILCSRHSIQRPWINFEAGAGWIRRIPVIPICHSGFSRGELPPPLSMLQAIDATNSDNLKILFQTISKAIVCNNPDQDFPTLTKKIIDFEKLYMTTPAPASDSTKPVSDPSTILFIRNECHFRPMGQDMVGGMMILKPTHAKHLEYRFVGSFFNGSNRNLGLCDLAILFEKDGLLLHQEVPTDYSGVTLGGRRSSRPVHTLTLPSLDWKEITFSGVITHTEVSVPLSADKISLSAKAVTGENFRWELTDHFDVLE